MSRIRAETTGSGAKRPAGRVGEESPPNRTAGPSRAKLIHLLIEERAKFIAMCNRHTYQGIPLAPLDKHRDQARREIEAQVLRPAAATTCIHNNQNHGK